jgi:hypothetical protein
MRLRQRLWTTAVLAATTVLVVGVIEPERVAEEARFDEPGAAAQFDFERRRPRGSAADMAALHDAAAAGLARLGRFSSAINRMLPDSQPQARVWFSANRVVAATDRSSATEILDAWTPLGPGNIGGRTRVVRFHPIVHTTLFAAGVSGGV